MTDLDLHHEFDRLAVGRSHQPDLSAIMAGGRRRRRRTRLAWTAAGLATAAVVAPLALLVGGGATTAPSGTSGFAAAPAAATNEADPLAIEAAVLEVFPGAQADESTPGTFTLANGVILEVRSGSASMFVCEICDVVTVGGQEVWTGPGIGGRADGPTWYTEATTRPVTASDGSAVQVSVLASVVADTKAEGEAALPPSDLLTALAGDARLRPETGWTEAPAGETAALVAIGQAVDERIPGLRVTSADDSDRVLDETFVGAGGAGNATGQRLVARDKTYDATSAGFDRLGVWSGTDSYRQECPDENTHRYSCTQVGDLTVQVMGGRDAQFGEGFWNVSVYPTDPSRTEKVEVNAFVKADSFEEAAEKLPSVETLTEIALDERLVPPVL